MRFSQISGWKHDMKHICLNQAIWIHRHLFLCVLIRDGGHFTCVDRPVSEQSRVLLDIPAVPGRMFPGNLENSGRLQFDAV